MSTVSGSNFAVNDRHVWVRERTWVLGHVAVMNGWTGWGRQRRSALFLLAVVAVFEVFTLNVSSAVVCARQLKAILVHTPAYASFASTRWFTLTARKQGYRDI